MKRSLVVLSLYLLLAVVCTYPLPLQLSSQAPAGEAWTYDGFSMIWNVWWFKHALLDLNTNPFVTNSIFAPLGANLYLHSYTLFSDLLALPLLAFLTPVTESNLILIGSLALCGYGMYLLVEFAICDLRFANEVPNQKSKINNQQLEGAAFVAGVVFAITTSRFVFLAQGHYNFFTTEWLPFYWLYWLKATRRPTRQHILMAGLFLALALLVELSLGVLLLLATGLYWLLRAKPSTQRLRELGTIAAIALVAVVLDAAYLLPTVRESFDARYIPQYWGGAPVLSTDVVGMFTPSSLSTFFGTHDWSREWLQVLQRQSRFVDVNTFVVGFGVALLALLGALTQWRRARVWLWLALCLSVLSWGPILHVNGKSQFDLDGMTMTVGLPYIALHYIPILSGLRAPHRFSVIAVMFLALLVGFAAAWLLARVRAAPLTQGFVLALLLVGVSVEHVTLPVPLSDATIPTVYERIAREAGDFTVMEVPLGWRSGFGPVGTENTRLQYFQVAHGKRLISGFAARTPSFLFDYFERQPILNAIAMLEVEGKLPKGDAVHDKALAAELAYFFDLRYLVVHPPERAPTPYNTTMARVHDYVREVFDLTEVESSDGITLYSVAQPAARDSLLVDFGADASSLNRAEGWDRDEEVAGATANWMVEREARVWLPLRTAGAYRLTLRAAPFAYANHLPQSLDVHLNGATITRALPLADGWNEYTLDLPASAIAYGLNELTLATAHSAAPAAVLPSSGDTRLLSVAVDWIRVDRQ